MSSISVEDVAKEYGVSVEYLKNNEVSDEHVLLFSKYCDPWEEMAPYFGHDQATITAIDSDNRTTELKRNAVILKWKEAKAFVATYYRLIGIFLKHNKATSAASICAILKDSMPALQPSSSHIQPARQLPEDPAPQHPTPPYGPVNIDLDNSPLDPSGTKDLYQDSITMVTKDETPRLVDDDTEYLERKPVNPPREGTPEYAELLQFRDKVKIILHVVNKTELRAAIRFMKPPNQHYKKAVSNFPYPSMYVGMFAGMETALVQTQAGNYCRSMIKKAIEAFKNAKYIILVGVCYAFSRDKYKLGDVLVSNAISDMKNWKINDDGLVQDRGQTINTESFLHYIFCNDETHDPPFNASNARQSNVHSGLFVSFPVLMNNKEMRDKFHSVRDYALAGEMEGETVLEFLTDEKKVDGIIVIKGAADYGDGTKEKNWQFTAAMAALHYTHSKLSAVNFPS